MYSPGESFWDNDFAKFHGATNLPLLDCDYRVDLQFFIRNDVNIFADIVIGSEVLVADLVYYQAVLSDQKILSIGIPELGYNFEPSDELLGGLSAKLNHTGKLSISTWKELPSTLDVSVNFYEAAYKAQFHPKYGTLRVGYQSGRVSIGIGRYYSLLKGGDLYNIELSKCAITAPKFKSMEYGSKKLAVISYDITYEDYSIANNGNAFNLKT